MRLGLIVPSSNTTMEAEGRKFISKEHTLHVGRLKLEEVTANALIEMEKDLEDEAEKLADAEVDIMGYGCTTGSLVRGLGHAIEIERRIEDRTGIPAIATAASVVRALKFLEARKVVVATPYTDELNSLEKQFLEGNGITVLRIAGLSYKDNTKIGRVDDETVRNLVKSLPYNDADAIFISCTNLPTINVVQPLEEELSRQVVSSNTATFWNMFAKAGLVLPIRGYGTLLESLGSRRVLLSI